MEEERNIMELDDLNDANINNIEVVTSNDNDINKNNENINDEVIEEVVDAVDAVVEDDDVLKGVAIGDNDEFLNDSDEDDGPVFHITKIQKANSSTPSANRRLSSDRASRTYIRPQQPQLIDNNDIQNETDEKNTNTNDDEIKKLRFPHHRTAFDIVLDDLDINETPWRSKLIPVDLSDYFNYGFNEHSWKIYAERQLKFRAFTLKLGPPALYARPVSQQVAPASASLIDDEYEEPGPVVMNEIKVETNNNVVGNTVKASNEPPPQFQQPMVPPPQMFPSGRPPQMFPSGQQQMSAHHMWGMDPRFGMHQHQHQGGPQHQHQGGPQHQHQGGPQQPHQGVSQQAHQGMPHLPQMSQQPQMPQPNHQGMPQQSNQGMPQQSNQGMPYPNERRGGPYPIDNNKFDRDEKRRDDYNDRDRRGTERRDDRRGNERRDDRRSRSRDRDDRRGSERRDDRRDDRKRSRSRERDRRDDRKRSRSRDRRR